jgi:hypothetical protein
MVLRVYIFRARALISTCVGSEEDYFLFILEAKRDSVIPIILMVVGKYTTRLERLLLLDSVRVDP